MFGAIVMYTLLGLIGAGVVALFLYMVVIGPMLGKKELARMERELPELAARRGLEFRQARDKRKFGKMKGEVRGHKVEVCPDVGRQFRVRVKADLSCHVSTDKHGIRPRDDQREFEFFDLDLNSYFVIKLASPELAERFSGTDARLDALVRLVREHGKELRLLLIKDDDIFAGVKQRWSTDFEAHSQMYITPEQFEWVVTALVDVAEELEILGRGNGHMPKRESPLVVFQVADERKIGPAGP